MTSFAQQLLRLKQALGVVEDQAVAEALGMTKASFSARKQRGSFPQDKVFALQAKRPDLQLDVDYVLTGKTAQATAAALAASTVTAAPRIRPTGGDGEASQLALSTRGTYTTDREREEQELLADLKRCAPSDRAAIRHLVARLAETKR